MASKKKGSGGVVRRGSGERKRLPPDLEEFARSDEKRYRPARKHRPRLKDPRPAAVMPGVRNLDARDVHDQRAARMHSLLDSLAAGGAEGKAARPELDRLLAEAFLLAHHRGRSFVSFDAFVDTDLKLTPDDAMIHVDAGLEAMGLEREPLTDETVAIVMRTEAALLPKEGERRLEAKVRVYRDEAGEERVTIDVEAARAAPVLHAIGRQMTQLAEDQGVYTGRPPRAPRPGDDRDDRGPRGPRGGGDRGPKR